ncbi:glycosyltransferase family 4 protein [Spirosoma aerophilum]
MTILYLTFYFEPDIGPGSFRNTAFVRELASQLYSGATIHVITTQPNRYQAYRPAAPECEIWSEGQCPVVIERIRVPAHKSGQFGQIRAFAVYCRAVYQLTRNRQYKLVVASSSRLFTAFLGAIFARKRHIPLVLDIRDLFREVMLDMYRNSLLRAALAWGLGLVEQYTFSYARHINLVSEGYKPYFLRFPKATYSYFSNGIDDVFLTIPASHPNGDLDCKTILYAGNIGEGQGLHKIIPQVARQLGNGYRFVIFGDGGARKALEAAIETEGVSNVEVREPISQHVLADHYQTADYLFVHLNDLDSLTRALPSKLFELGATDKPILAGVSGYAASFVRHHLTNTILFAPGDVADLVSQLRTTPYYTKSRTKFRALFQRQAISQAMARLVVNILNDALRNESAGPL